MAANVVIAPVLVAIVAAIGTLLSRSAPRVQRGVSLAGGLGYLVAVGWLLVAIRDAADNILVYQVSGWPAPFGITLVGDALAGFMLALAALVTLPALAFSTRFISQRGQRLSYHPLFHLLVVGVTGAFLTGDLFNLFVWFEVMLMASYVLVVFYSGPEHTRAALQYVVLNLAGSALMLLAIGGLYSTIGTLNMADMARRLADAASYGIDPTPVLGLSALLFVVFALKAGIVPFQFWVPAAYRAAPAPVSAVLAGVVKKVGIYAIIRLYFTVFAAATLPAELSLPGLAGDSMLAFFGPILALMATGSVLLGGFGALSRSDLDGVLAYSSISQIGFIVFPIAIGATVSDPRVRALAITAALVYTLNHGLAKAALFLASGAIERTAGTTRLSALGGLAGTRPVLSASFLLGGFALVGIPPLTGFFGKLLVFDTAARAGAGVGIEAEGIVGGGVGAVLALGVMLLGAILTIAYITRAWNQGFWGAPSPAVETATSPRVLVAIVAALAATLLILGIGFDPVLRGANAAAEAALAREEYVRAVAPEVIG